MFENETPSIMIVKSTRKESRYAEFLFQLIGMTPNFESSQPITESEYNDSFTTIDNIPKGKVIFFGNGEECATQGKSIHWQYNNFGMKYGWLGNRCVMVADPDAISTKQLNAFADYYNEHVESFRQYIDLQELH